MSKKARASPSAAASEAARSDDHLALERLVFFSDAVFAIAITLLALEIRLPASEAIASDAQLLDALLGAWHRYLAFAISFLVIGSFWVAHHRKFRYIQRYDSGLVTLNLLMLMVIAFLPFPSAVLSDYGNRTATIFYALTMTLAGLLFVALWWHATWNNRLVDSRLDARERRREFGAPLSTVAVFVLSIGLAYLDAGLVRLAWLLILPISAFFNRQPMSGANPSSSSR